MTDIKSNVVGVSWHKARQKWQAYIQIGVYKYHGGYYIKHEDAVEARRELERTFYGEAKNDTGRISG